VKPAGMNLTAALRDRRVKALTIGREKARISVDFASIAARDKLDPVIHLPHKTPLKDYVPPPNLVITYGTNGNFSAKEILEIFLNQVNLSHL